MCVGFFGRDADPDGVAPDPDPNLKKTAFLSIDITTLESIYTEERLRFKKEFLICEFRLGSGPLGKTGSNRYSRIRIRNPRFKKRLPTDSIALIEV